MKKIKDMTSDEIYLVGCAWIERGIRIRKAADDMTRSEVYQLKAINLATRQMMVAKDILKVALELMTKELIYETKYSI